MPIGASTAVPLDILAAMAAEPTDLAVYNLLCQIVGLLVDHTDAVQVTPTSRSNRKACVSLWQFTAERPEKLIGKQGTPLRQCVYSYRNRNEDAAAIYLDIIQTPRPQASPEKPSNYIPTQSPETHPPVAYQPRKGARAGFEHSVRAWYRPSVLVPYADAEVRCNRPTSEERYGYQEQHANR